MKQHFLPKHFPNRNSNSSKPDSNGMDLVVSHGKTGRGKEGETRESNRSSPGVPAILGAPRGVHMPKTKLGKLGGDLRSSNAHKEIEHLQRASGTSVVFDISNRDVRPRHPDHQVEHETVIMAQWLL